MHLHPAAHSYTLHLHLRPALTAGIWSLHTAPAPSICIGTPHPPSSPSSRICTCICIHLDPASSLCILHLHPTFPSASKSHIPHSPPSTGTRTPDLRLHLNLHPTPTSASCSLHPASCTCTCTFYPAAHTPRLPSTSPSSHWQPASGTCIAHPTSASLPPHRNPVAASHLCLRPVFILHPMTPICIQHLEPTFLSAPKSHISTHNSHLHLHPNLHPTSHDDGIWPFFVLSAHGHGAEAG